MQKDAESLFSSTEDHLLIPLDDDWKTENYEKTYNGRNEPIDEIKDSVFGGNMNSYYDMDTYYDILEQEAIAGRLAIVYENEKNSLNEKIKDARRKEKASDVKALSKKLNGLEAFNEYYKMLYDAAQADNLDAVYKQEKGSLEDKILEDARQRGNSSELFSIRLNALEYIYRELKDTRKYNFCKKCRHNIAKYFRNNPKLASCPDCGEPIEPTKNRWKLWTTILVIIVLAFSIIYGVIKYNEKTPGKTDTGKINAENTSSPSPKVEEKTTSPSSTAQIINSKKVDNTVIDKMQNSPLFVHSKPKACNYIYKKRDENNTDTSLEKYKNSVSEAKALKESNCLHIPPIGILFENNTTDTKNKDAFLLIHNFVELYKKSDGKSKILIKGYSISKNDKSSNLGHLAYKRAETIKNYIVYYDKTLQEKIEIESEIIDESKWNFNQFADRNCSSSGCGRRVNISIKDKK